MVELEEITEPPSQPSSGNAEHPTVNPPPQPPTSSQSSAAVSQPAEDPSVPVTSAAPAEETAGDRVKEGPSDGAGAVRSTTVHSEDSFHDADDQGLSGDRETSSSTEEAAGAGASEEEERFEDSMTEEELRKAAIGEADSVKAKGNAAYSQKDFIKAIDLYSAALDACPVHDDSAELRSVCHANKAMCLLCLEKYSEAVKSCSAALELKPGYMKALLRRSQAHEKMDKLEEALADAQKVVEMDGKNAVAVATVRRLTPIVEERREKLKDEMLGKLKDLGNSILGNFGMSLDNFKAVKDPATGSYSISYQN